MEFEVTEPEQPPKEEKPKGPPLYKRRSFWWISAALFIVVIAGSCWLYHEARTYVSTNDAYIESKKISISPDIAGRIHRIHVHEGSCVKRGELIVEIDATIYEAKKEKAQREHVRAQKMAMQAEQRLLKIEEDFMRINAAFEMGVATQKERDNLFRDFEMAKIGALISRVDVEIALAEIALIEEEMRHLQIHSPCDGVIAKRWLWEGDTAAFGQSILILNDLSDLWVTANLEEKKLTHVHIGDPVEIHVDSYPDYTFVGKVFTIKAMAASQVSLLPPDNATGNFTKVEQRIPIKITLEPMEPHQKRSDLKLFPGMSVEVKMQIR